MSVDGVALDELDPLAADDSLNGTVGATKMIGLGNAHTAGLANTTRHGPGRRSDPAACALALTAARASLT